MPATYRHVHTYEQITGRGRNTWQKPEPAPPPKPRKYFILGVEVDYNTYHDFMYERDYRVDGDILKDIPCALWLLEKYATDEHAKERPVEAANARKILDQIREEIATITRKEDKPMNEPRTAAEFIDALKEIYTESRNMYAALQDKVDKAKAKMERAHEELRDPECKDKLVAESRYNIARGEWQLAEGDRRGEYQQMCTSHEKKVAELREKFIYHLDEYYSASPDKLDSSTMELLNSGICTPSELARLAERHKGNPTMRRVIAAHAEKITDERNQSQEDYMTCRKIVIEAAAAKDGSRELAIFDSAAGAALYGLDKEPIHASRMHTHIEGWFDNFRDKMVNLPAIPEEMAPATEK